MSFGRDNSHYCKYRGIWSIKKISSNLRYFWNHTFKIDVFKLWTPPLLWTFIILWNIACNSLLITKMKHLSEHLNVFFAMEGRRKAWGEAWQSGWSTSDSVDPFWIIESEHPWWQCELRGELVMREIREGGDKRCDSLLCPGEGLSKSCNFRNEIM